MIKVGTGTKPGRTDPNKNIPKTPTQTGKYGKDGRGTDFRCQWGIRVGDGDSLESSRRVGTSTVVPTRIPHDTSHRVGGREDPLTST